LKGPTLPCALELGGGCRSFGRSQGPCTCGERGTRGTGWTDKMPRKSRTQDTLRKWWVMDSL
jgi:hypothetical protein